MPSCKHPGKKRATVSTAGLRSEGRGEVGAEKWDLEGYYCQYSIVVILLAVGVLIENNVGVET